LKKRTKKRLFTVGFCPLLATTHSKQEFFASFFTKKEALSCGLQTASRRIIRLIS
jgi:hypothetical protein